MTFRRKEVKDRHADREEKKCERRSITFRKIHMEKEKERMQEKDKR